MTTVKSLNEDLLYTILSKCSSSIDMWNFLLALDYELTRMINLRAFWSHIRLSSSHNKNILFSFVKEIGIYCIDLRIDNLNWMITADIRRLLSNFHSLVCFHTGNVSLSKSTLINDIKTLFPFLKYIHLLISLDDLTISSSIQQCSIIDNIFQGICISLNQINQLEHISLILQDKKGGCLSDRNARLYFRLVCEYISNMTNSYKLLSIEENHYEIKNRFLSNNIVEEISSELINLSLISTLNHLIISFRSILNLNLTLKIKDSTKNKLLQLQTLVLPCVPSTLESIDILDLNQLKILDIGYVNVIDRMELIRLDHILLCHRQHSLKNLTISLSEWQSARLVVIRKNKNNRQITTSIEQFSSVFENCFNQEIISDDAEEEEAKNEKKNFVNQSLDLEQTLSNIIDEFSLEFIDDNQTSIFQLSLNYSWLNKLTNLNLTGIHCHSIDFKYIFNSLYLLRSLNLHHLSIRIPNYELHINDLNIEKTNHLKSIIFDVKIPITFHTKLTQLYSKNIFNSLRRFILITNKNFQLTPLLIDKFSTLELIEIISINYHLNRSTINYLEKVLKPTNYPNLNIFRLCIGSIDANHLLKHLNKTIRLAFEKFKPSFQFNISIINSSTELIHQTYKSILYDNTNEIQQNFHSLLSIHSNQLSIIYPKFLNYKLLYSEQIFDK